MTRVVITGIGTLTPAGRGTEALWTRIVSGETCIAPIDSQKYFDASRYACQLAGQVPAFSEPRVLTTKIMARTDRCSQMALIAVLDALEMARLPLDFRSKDSPVASNRVFLLVATNAAGWTYLERGIQNLWTKGRKAMSLHSLTAGFLAGPQGHVSIFFGIEGGTRTFVSERIGGAYALIEGARAIQRGDAEVVIAGGTEAPLSPLSWAAYHSAHTLQSTAQHQPLGEDRGMLIGEGSTFLVLEEREHALQRGVPILAEIRAWSRGTDPYPLQGSSKQPGKGLTQIIHKALTDIDIQPTAIDVIFPAGPSFTQENSIEETAITNVFGQLSSIAMSKAVLGHLQGAAVATDAAIATLALDRQQIPPTQDTLVHSPSSTIHERTDSPMKHALILSGGLGGTHASLIISKG